MLALKLRPIALIIGATTLTALTACGGDDNNDSGSAGSSSSSISSSASSSTSSASSSSATSSASSSSSSVAVDPTDPQGLTLAVDPADKRSLNGIVVGNSDWTVPTGVDVPLTMMGHMMYLFDQVKTYGTDMTMNLGDGTAPAKVLDPNTGDQFLPGKLALGLSYVLIDMKTRNDARYQDYLAVYKDITRKMMAKNTSGGWVYTNKSFGEYYYLLALNNFKDKGMLDEVFDPDMIDILKQRLTFDDMFSDVNNYVLNTAQNYYAVAYGIAGLRLRLGWTNTPANARDDILAKLLNHYRTHSTAGVSDETDGNGRFDRYSVLLIAETFQRTYEMGNDAAITDEMKGYLRNSVDIIMPQLNVDGKGFNYGRSLAPYGDNAFMEVLTAAARVGVLSEAEKRIAYAFVERVANRYMNFWYDVDAHSVNMWVKGRGTDAYRSTKRTLGENFSLLHQFLYVNGHWNRMGLQNKAPMPVANFQQWLDTRQPKLHVTQYDTNSPYSRTLVTIRDGKRVINLNFVNGENPYFNQNPYFPIPTADNLVYGTADATYPLLVPRISLSTGKQYMPIIYYKNLQVKQEGDTITISYDQDSLANTNGTWSTAPWAGMTSKTTYVIKSGWITRTDTFTPTADVTVNAIQQDFGSFSDMTGAVQTGTSVNWATGDAYQYETTGYDGCTLAPFGTVTNATTPIGKLLSNMSCKTTTPALWPAGSTHTYSWSMKFKPLQ
ncbi:hypothetical protein ACDA63_06275 [Uliginosibacterium sp. sgz301328]|uniref:hypothetical protein n=1 Tax=Uliginosibacterium sp. sgz301328 TaxID=3243764 RepID=UPI00359DCD85